MKKLCTMFLAASISAVSCMTAFGGQWVQDSTGWWYDNGDSTFAQNGWQWIDGKCYYFTPEGYCLQNTTTPDGYSVDANGAWIVDGVVQERYSVGHLTITVPNGAEYAMEDDDRLFLTYERLGAAVEIESSETEFNYDNVNRRKLDSAVDSMIREFDGDYETKEEVQLDSGIWTRYYVPFPGGEKEGDATIYIRVKGHYRDMVTFAGDFSRYNLNAVMNEMIPQI